MGARAIGSRSAHHRADSAADAADSTTIASSMATADTKHAGIAGTASPSTTTEDGTAVGRTSESNATAAEYAITANNESTTSADHGTAACRAVGFAQPGPTNVAGADTTSGIAIAKLGATPVAGVRVAAAATKCATKFAHKSAVGIPGIESTTTMSPSCTSTAAISSGSFGRDLHPTTTAAAAAAETIILATGAAMHQRHG